MKPPSRVVTVITHVPVSLKLRLPSLSTVQTLSLLDDQITSVWFAPPMPSVFFGRTVAVILSVVPTTAFVISVLSTLTPVTGVFAKETYTLSEYVLPL